MTTKVKLDANETPTAETQLVLGSGEKSIIIPPLGVGLWAWGDSSTWGYNSYDKVFGEKSMEEAFETTVRLGVSFFDTAEVYGSGKSEQFLGNFIKNQATESSQANKIIVATNYIFYPTALLEHLRASLKRLQIESVDLYQVHAPIHLHSVETLASALADAVDAGLTKTVGVSNYNIAEMRRMHAALQKRGIQLASNQVEFSLLRSSPLSTGLIDEAHKLGVAILAYSPLGMGRLSGKYSSTNLPSGSRRFGNLPWEQIDPIIVKLREIGTKYERTPAQVALNWIICKGAIPIPGAKNAKQAEENSKALGFRLSDEEIAEFDKLAIGNPTPFPTSLFQHG